MRNLTFILATGAFMAQATAVYADDTKANTPAPAPTPPIPGVVIRGSENLIWDTNPLMLPGGGHKTLFGSITKPELILQGKTPTDSFKSETEIDVNVFNQAAFNSTDAHENLELRRQLQQWGAGIKGGVDYDTTRTSEITTYGINLPYVRHTGMTATPDISYKATSVDKITLAGTATKSTYNNAAFVDYEVFSLNPSYEHNFDPMNKGIFTMNAQRYRALEGSEGKVDTFGPTVGWETILTPRFKIRADAGFQRSQQSATATTASDSSWNYVFDADLSYQSEQDKADFIAARTQQPFANGTDTLLTSFTAKEEHAINKRLSVNAAANYQFADQPSGFSGTVNLDKEYGGLAGITYHVLETVDLAGNYQYRNETLVGQSGTIDDHIFLVGLSFHPFEATQ